MIKLVSARTNHLTGERIKEVEWEISKHLSKGNEIQVGDWIHLEEKNYEVTEKQVIYYEDEKQLWYVVKEAFPLLKVIREKLKEKQINEKK